MARSLIRIIYPPTDGRIILRTSTDWDADIEADRVSEDGTSSSFHVDTDKPYFYFKPCIRARGGALHWSKGANYLAITSAPGDKDVYPHFFDGLEGTISGVSEIPSSSPARHPVRAYLPPGYFENTLKRYPTLYMHDGSNLFFPQEAFMGQTWEVDKTMGVLDAMSLIDKVIIIGVWAKDRMNEYTRPGYEAYGRYLVEELKPAIDTELRTLAGPETTAVMGSSLGGVVSLYLAWQWPEVFGKAACLSSTFGYRDDLEERIGREEKRPVRLYLDSGWPGDNYEATRTLRDALLKAGYAIGGELFYLAFPNALHDEHSWAIRSHIPFQVFFGKAPRFT
jgi:predicted alpha/beta superfamily hydrolase